MRWLFLVLLICYKLSANAGIVNDSATIKMAYLYRDMVNLLKVDTSQVFVFSYGFVYGEEFVEDEKVSEEKFNKIKQLNAKGYAYQFTDTMFDAGFSYASTVTKTQKYHVDTMLKEVQELKAYGLSGFRILHNAITGEEREDVIARALRDKSRMKGIKTDVLLQMASRLHTARELDYAAFFLNECLLRGVEADSVYMMLWEQVRAWGYGHDSLRAALLEKALQLNPGLPTKMETFYEELGFSLLRCAKHRQVDDKYYFDKKILAKAISIARLAVERQPTDNHYGMLAVFLYYNGELDQAKENAERAILLNPESYHAKNVLGFIKGDFYRDPIEEY